MQQAELIQAIQSLVTALERFAGNKVQVTQGIVPELRHLIAGELRHSRPLYQAGRDGMRASALRDSSRHWRLLFQLMAGSAEGEAEAVDILDKLGVVRVKRTGRRGWIYYHPEAVIF